ncbi:ATP-dependent Clp protease proteolytic subunit [Bacillus phage vB_BauM_KLEB27-3]|nr:ATP-dependent Clp protease proteolytic subunit [Bacillus phage vB_BauM_KLEB27-3]
MSDQLERDLFLAGNVEEENINKLIQEIMKINKEDDDEEKESVDKKQYKAFQEGTVSSIEEINSIESDYKRKPIRLYITTYGGAVYDELALVDIINSSKTPIYTIALGKAMSAGFNILIHGHKRFAYKNATMMYHQVSTGHYGKVQDIEERFKESQRLQDMGEKMVIEKTKITKELVEKNTRQKQDWYMDAEEALSLGVIDEILN